MLEGIITELVDSVCRDSADTQYVYDNTKITLSMHLCSLYAY